MAVRDPHEPVTTFEDWYIRYEVDERTGCLRNPTMSPCAQRYWSEYEEFKREHNGRVGNYFKYELMADAEVVSRKPDLPNVSSGEIAGMVRRTARNVVQHTPNVEIVNEFDDDSSKGILAMHILRSKILGEELNSNEMQQHLFASTMSAFTLGFDAVTPVLEQKADGSWCMEYDSLHYRDVFPEPGVKEARKSPVFYVRRYLTRGEAARLIRNNVAGWDHAALRAMAQNAPPARQAESVSAQDAKHRTMPRGYEIVTWYSDSGDPFLTFDANSKMLLRIEKNKDPLKRVPVQWLTLEKDPQQPLGKSQIALVFGRQEFQDLMLNGAMKLWYRNINPTLIGYGTGLNGVPNMGPGKYTNIPNPNAKVEAFEVSTQTLLQYGTISAQNMGSMVNLVGAADQQLAAAAGGGMSQTPQGVEAQQQMVDITTNNYQKAVENFFSHYCSYALTVYFQELKNEGKIKPTADTRKKLLDAGIPAEKFNEDGVLDIDLKEMATVYHVRCVPGSLVELEDEKQLRVLHELLVPISQAMPAFANTQNQDMLAKAASAIEYIITKQIELSGSAHSGELKRLMSGGDPAERERRLEKVDQLESVIEGYDTRLSESAALQEAMVLQMQEQMGMLREAQQLIMQGLGINTEAPAPQEPNPAPALSVVPNG